MGRNTFSPGLLSLGLALLSVLAYGLFASRVQAPGSSWGLVLLAGICVGLLQYITKRVRSNEQVSAQSERDRQAAETTTVAEHDRPFWIYLRPFLSTGKLLVKNPEYSFLPSIDRFAENALTDAETLIARTLEPSARLIAFGRPGEHIGGGRLLTTEKKWRDEFAELAQRAAGIVLVPSAREGTLWEMRWLKEHGHLHKCVFVMYPQLEAGDFDVSEAWTAAQAASSQLGMSLPDHQQEGKLFLFDQDGRLLMQRTFQPEALLELRDFMKGEGGSRAQQREAEPGPVSRLRRSRVLRVLAIPTAMIGTAWIMTLQNPEVPLQSSASAVRGPAIDEAPVVGNQELNRAAAVPNDRSMEKAALLARLCQRRAVISRAAAPPYQIKDFSSLKNRVAAIKTALGSFCEELDAHTEWARRGRMLEGGISWSIPEQAYRTAANACHARLRAIEELEPRTLNRGGQKQLSELAQRELEYADSYTRFCPRTQTTVEDLFESAPGSQSQTERSPIQ